MIPTGMFIRYKESLTFVLLTEIKLKCFGSLCQEAIMSITNTVEDIRVCSIETHV